MWMAKPLECGREAAAFNNPNKEGGSFATALQGALRARISQKPCGIGRDVDVPRSEFF
jgi:hypothetical protein